MIITNNNILIFSGTFSIKTRNLNNRCKARFLFFFTPTLREIFPYKNYQEIQIHKRSLCGSCFVYLKRRCCITMIFLAWWFELLSFG